jgi:hypothetical protein
VAVALAVEVVVGGRRVRARRVLHQRRRAWIEDAEVEATIHEERRDKV